MTILEQLKRILSNEPAAHEGWSQEQREAAMDLLLLGIYIDGKLTVKETDLLEKQIDAMTQTTGVDWDAYAAKSLHHIREIEGDPELRHQFVQDIRNRLGDTEKRQAAVQDLNALLKVDGRVPVEKTFLEDVKALFRLRPIAGEED